MGLYKDSLKTKDEYPSAIVFKGILDLMVGDGLIDKFGDTSEEFYTELADLYHSYEADFWRPFEKTRYTLEKLANIEGLKLAVLSNHPHHNCIVDILKKHDFLDYFHTIVTSAKFGKRKPHPDIFHYTIKKMGLEKKDIGSCIMCGDEYADISGGNRVGLKTILFERFYKFPFEKEIEIPNIIKVSDISGILDHIVV